MHTDTPLHGPRPPMILLLKATVKKQVWVPQFTKKNGQVVGGHYAHVHVTDDHDHHKVSSGQGSYSQKKAHAQLADEPEFHALPAEEKAALVMHHATQIQDAESQAARIATLRKKLLAGGKPTPGEWKAFHAAAPEKQQAVTEAVHAAGHGAHMDSLYAGYVGALAPAAPQSEPQNIPENMPAGETPPGGKPEREIPASDLPPGAKPAAQAADAGKKARTVVLMGRPKAAEPAETGKSPDPAVSALAVPEFEEGKTTTGVKAHYEKTAGKIIGLAHAGDVAALEALPNPEKGNSWKGKTGNSKALMALHAQALAHAKGEKPAAPATAAEPAPAAAPHPSDALVADLKAAGFDAKHHKGMGTVLAKDGSIKTYANTTQAGNAAIKLGGAGFDAHVIGTHPFYVKIDGPKQADAGPKEGDTKEGKGGTLVLKDGHWVLSATDNTAMDFMVDAVNGPKLVKEAAQEWLDANPGQQSELHSVLTTLGFDEYAADYATSGPTHAAQVAAATAEPDDSKAVQALADAFEAAKVPAENTNAKVFNPKVDQIIAALKAGDTNALLAMSYGTNTYGKKAAKLANEALLFLGTRHAVSPGQKAGTHPKLKVVSVKQNGTGGETAPAAPASAPQPAAAAAPAPAAPAAAPEPAATPANTGPVALTQDEVDAVPAPGAGAYDGYTNAVKKMAQKGDAEQLEKYVGQLHAAGYKVDADHAQAVLDAMHVKAGVPVPPAMIGLNATKQGIVKEAQQALATGDIAKLETLDASTAGLHSFQSTNDYVKQAMAHLGKQSGTGSQTPTPAAADEAAIQGWIDTIGAGKAPTKAQAEALEALKLSNPDAYEDAASEAQVAYATGPGGIDMPDEYMAGEAMKKVDELHASALAGGEQGPKDGDTKEGADGMLVFQDGRWHKMGTDPQVLKQKAAAVALPKMSGKNSIKLGKAAKQLKAVAEAKGGAGLAHVVKVDEEAGTVKVTGWVTLSYKQTSKYGDNAWQFAQYAKNLVDSMAGTKGSDAPPAAPAAEPAAPAAPATATATVTVPKTEKVGKITAMLADGWEQTGPQKGSNPGGKFKDGKGQEWYCKFPSDPDTVKNELLAAKFYQMLGADVPELRLVKKDGKLGIASKWVDGIQKVDASALGKADGAHTGFVFDAWLANWDVVGLTNDNLMVDKTGRALRVDVGGSLLYRAQGGPKGSAFGETVPELESLLDPTMNSNSAAVFAGMTPEAMLAGAQQLAKMHPNQIDKLCRTFGPGTRAQQQELAAKLVARRDFILKKMGVTDPWNAPPPDITQLPVNPADMPPPIDFNNYMGTGKGLSSKQLLNHQNSIDDAALIAFAKQGNLKALQDYHYDAFDKETGSYIGKKPIAQHPNKDIKNHHAALCDLLTAVAHPPVEGLDLPPIGGGSIEEVSEQAGFVKPGENIKTVSADKVVGFWMKLGHVGADAVKDLIPEKSSYLKSDFVTKAKKWYKGAGEGTKALVNSVLNSGQYNRFWNNGDKHIAISSHGHSYNGGAQSLAKQIYDEAFEFEGGETVGRWMNLPDTMKQQLLKEGAGLVLQNADSMCTSIFKDWGANAKFGSGAYLNIRFAKGAKAMASLGSGRFAGSGQDAEGNYIHANGGGEMEITTLMGQRFVVLEVKQGNASSPSGITIELLALPPHDGYVADLGEMASLGKAIYRGATNALRKSVVVFFKQPVETK